MKFRRTSEERLLPFCDERGIPFRYCKTDRIDEALHKIDQKAAGSMATAGMPDNEVRLQFLVDGHIAEAISSAQLEGASTGHEVAASLLRSGNDPEDKDQRMIVNTYLAMRGLSESPDELTIEGIQALHRRIAYRALKDAEDAGRFQTPTEERVCVRDNRSHEILHTPPPAKLIPKRMQQLCDFANEQKREQRFLHPLLRAICAHFWLAYDHPFVDGNGRAARMLYYWLAVKKGYWMLEYVPISSILHRQPGKYAMAYQYVESDDNDMTYFFEYQLQIVVTQMDEFLELVARRTKEIAELEHKLRSKSFNHRQLALLSHAMREPAKEYTAKTHSNSHRVSPMTARKDLEQLVAEGYLGYGQQVGKMKTYKAIRGKLRSKKT